MPERNQPELLAPAGSPDALIAALRCGADAVYVGADRFSARQHAKNFDTQALREAASLCHLYGAKLYLTVNTLLFDSQMAALAAFAETAVACGVDAWIVQDLGVVSLLRELIPDLPLHASTQMSVHTPAGVAEAKTMGMRRVVAARELSMTELAALCETGTEIEVFCHGALCMSVSGQCYLSAMVGSRSANRGLCAQACRLPFTAGGHPKSCALSLKDLSLVSHVAALRDMGVASLKIEGRMKRPEYVAAAVTAYRQALRGETPDLERLRAVFSRSGFTDGYFTGRRSDMFGVRQKEDVTAAKTALPALQALYAKPRKAAVLHAHAALYGDQPATLRVQDDSGAHAEITGEIPQPADKLPTDAERLTRQLSKLGDTIYSPGEMTLETDGNLMLPVSSLNAMRRQATAALDAARIAARTPCYPVGHAAELVEPLLRPQGQQLRIQAESAAQLEQIPADAYAFAMLPLAACCGACPVSKEKLMLVPPRLITNERLLQRQLEGLRKAGFQHLLCEDLAHIQLGRALGFVLHGGFGLHVTNSRSIAAYTAMGLTDLTLSFELQLSQIAALRGRIPCGALAYGRLPLMLMRSCPIRGEVGCKSCSGHLVDRTGRSFPVRCEGTYTELLNAEMLYLADRLPELSDLSFLTLLLYEETPAEAAAVVAAYRGGPDVKPQTFTRGLYYRGVE